MYFPSLKITPCDKKEIPPAGVRVIPNAATAGMAPAAHSRLPPLAFPVNQSHTCCWSPSPAVSHTYMPQECLFSPTNCRGNLGDLCSTDVSIGAYVNTAEPNQRDRFYLNVSQYNGLFRMGFILHNPLRVAALLCVPANTLGWG